jgi:hypothetical protein
MALVAFGFGRLWLWSPLALVAFGFGRLWLWSPLALVFNKLYVVSTSNNLLLLVFIIVKAK